MLLLGKTGRTDSIKVAWQRTGIQDNEFIIITGADDEDYLGRPISVQWTAVGIRQPSQEELDEPWRRFLRLSTSTLLYGNNPRMSILESFLAFELFLEAFIENEWKEPHSKSTLKHFRDLTTSTYTAVCILLHEVLGIPFVGSELWERWNSARKFRNAVAHGGRLMDVKVGQKFNNEYEIARFCYETCMRSIYFIRYYK
jgi:hypothetical protein